MPLLDPEVKTFLTELLKHFPGIILAKQLCKIRYAIG